MTVLKNRFATLLLAAAAFFAVSCDNNDEIKVDPDAEFDVVLEVKEAGPANPNQDIVVNASTMASIDAKIDFTSTTKSMTRLYITQNVAGAGEVIYEPSENIDLKGDGAVDLTGKNDKDFEYKFTLPVPSGISTGTVVYKFWTTSGNGDFRDVTKRLAVGPGTITMKFGTSANPATTIKSYTDVKLFTPTADAKSLTFVSLLDGTIYKIEQGEEYIAFWDFGYINLTDGGPALHSTFSYPTVAIPSLANITENKNKVYFKDSNKTSAEFEAIQVSSQLDFIVKPTDTFVKALVTGDIVEFVDQYNKKGMIKVLEAIPGNESTKFIRIAIKVQP